ncbi:MAG: hypothetical protein GY774_22305 [Planctomycetes bacterium]|nr:hypothetical protein [Planctomycetota bacterium]
MLESNDIANRKASHCDGSPPRAENSAIAGLLMKITTNDHRNEITTGKPFVKRLS